MAIRILLADDEERWRLITKDFLEHEGFEVLEAADGAEAIWLLRKNEDVALVILDIMMPVMDGVAACREIRRFSAVPVLMVTARDDEETELTCFGCGADEFVSKPVKMRPLIARVHAMLKRTGKSRDVLTLDTLEINFGAHSVTSAGERVFLTPKEYELLLLFVRNRNIALFRDTIYERVWETEYTGDSRTVDLHVQRLRKKLGWQDRLIAIYKVGYRLEVQP